MSESFLATDVAIAVHEMGHLFADKRAGITVVRAEMMSSGPLTGRVVVQDSIREDQVRWYLIAVAAGMEAERMFYDLVMGEVTSEDERHIEACSQTDREIFRKFASDPFAEGLTLPQACSLARVWLKPRFELLLVAAVRLVRQRTVQGSELQVSA